MNSIFTSALLAVFIFILAGCKATKPVNKTTITDNNQEKFSQFHQYDESSTITLDYSDYAKILDASAINLGMSDRYNISSNTGQIGTRLARNPKPSTATESNRFFYTSYQDNPHMKKVLQQVQEKMANIPNTINLATLSKAEQLAYWLNLYSITVINALVQQYPIRNLLKLLKGKDNFFDKSRFTFNGNQYSLNDIEYNIVAPLFNNDPLIMYGFYRGYIGGPSLVTYPFTAKNVYPILKANALQFVNSNRGVVIRGHATYVSSLYLEKLNYFPNFEEDLTDHLLSLLVNQPAEQQVINKLSLSISNYNITDIIGSDPQYGGGISTVNDPSIVADGFSDSFERSGANYIKQIGHVSRLRLEILKKIAQRYFEEKGRVTITDLPDKESTEN